MCYICVNIWSEYNGNGSVEYISKMIFCITSSNTFFFATTEITIACIHDYSVDSRKEMLEDFIPMWI